MILSNCCQKIEEKLILNLITTHLLFLLRIILLLMKAFKSYFSISIYFKISSIQILVIQKQMINLLQFFPKYLKIILMITFSFLRTNNNQMTLIMNNYKKRCKKIKNLGIKILNKQLVLAKIMVEMQIISNLMKLIKMIK